ncbi:MAG TPA: hypothetical protein DIT15_10795 [Arthrobacter bacterium]|nr:hypothetical protein [Arthrobacter sp.]
MPILPVADFLAMALPFLSPGPREFRRPWDSIQRSQKPVSIRSGLPAGVCDATEGTFSVRKRFLLGRIKVDGTVRLLIEIM